MLKARIAVVVALLGAIPAVGQHVSGPTPLTDSDFPVIDERLGDLGHLLFFDPLLSGNKNIACATCHHPTLGTSDGMSLSVGEGALGLGRLRRVTKTNKPLQRIPRNAPALFNLGAFGVSSLFHDGRLEVDPTEPYGFQMPKGRELERPISSILAAQALLPLLSFDEMAGHPGENEIADAVSAEQVHGPDGAWSMIARRVAGVPQYRQAFEEINGTGDIHINDIASAIGQFITAEFRAGYGLADAFVAGTGVMPTEAIRGAMLFEGKAGCVNCHYGPLMTDQKFHAIAMPQIGPGKAEGSKYYQDVGRYAVSGETEDLYRFRTPSLRNVGITAPYGHDGAFARLEDVVRHHLDPVTSLRDYRPELALLHREFDLEERRDFAAIQDASEIDAIAQANELTPVILTDSEVEQIVTYLRCLTDKSWAENGRGIPEAVPSGLPLDSSN